MNNAITSRFDEVYDETYHNTLRYVISKCDNMNNVEDIMQNVYLALYKVMNKNKHYINDYKSFLIKLSKNELFKFYSLKNKAKVLLNIDIDKEQDDGLSYIDNIKDEKIDIEKEITNNIAIENIWGAIKKYDILTQKIMALYYLEDLKIKDIAMYLDIGESQVKNKIYRVINCLKKELKEGEKNE